MNAYRTSCISGHKSLFNQSYFSRQYDESFSNAAPFRNPGTSGVSLQSSQNQPFNAPQGANASTNSATGTGKKSVSLLQDAIADLVRILFRLSIVDVLTFVVTSFLSLRALQRVIICLALSHLE